MKEQKFLPYSLSPWRCSFCSALMFDIEWKKGHSYPVPGAPIPHEGIPGYEKLCTLCLELYTALVGRGYWTAIQAGWKHERRENRKRSGSEGT